MKNINPAFSCVLPLPLFDGFLAKLDPSPKESRYVVIHFLPRVMHSYPIPLPSFFLSPISLIFSTHPLNMQSANIANQKDLPTFFLAQNGILFFCFLAFLLFSANQAISIRSIPAKLLVPASSQLAGLTGCLRDRPLSQDSPLVSAVRHGRVLVIDEADKAPLEVVPRLWSAVGLGGWWLRWVGGIWRAAILTTCQPKGDGENWTKTIVPEVCILKSLAEDGEFSLGDGRTIMKKELK